MTCEVRQRDLLYNVHFVDLLGKPVILGYTDEGILVTPMKYFVEEHLRLKWESQRERIVEHPLLNPIVASGNSLRLIPGIKDYYSKSVVLPDFDSRSQYSCLPLSDINLFVLSIHASRCSKGPKDTVIEYQRLWADTHDEILISPLEYQSPETNVTP